jgi:hypothetical protein
MSLGFYERCALRALDTGLSFDLDLPRGLVEVALDGREDRRYGPGRRELRRLLLAGLIENARTGYRITAAGKQALKEAKRA